MPVSDNAALACAKGSFENLVLGQLPASQDTIRSRAHTHVLPRKPQERSELAAAGGLAVRTAVTREYARILIGNKGNKGK